MGEPILILTLVVIVTGGIGSIRGAFYGALIVGIVDTIGRAFLPTLLREFLERSLAQAAGPAIASMLIYLLMAVVLALRPQGLFPVRMADSARRHRPLAPAPRAAGWLLAAGRSCSRWCRSSRR